MIRPKRVRAKEVFKNKSWIITSIIDDDRRYRIEAERSEPIKNELNHFVGYIGREYAQNLARDYYNCKIENGELLWMN
jgi:hypothetical protein